MCCCYVVVTNSMATIRMISGLWNRAAMAMHAMAECVVSAESRLCWVAPEVVTSTTVPRAVVTMDCHR